MTISSEVIPVLLARKAWIDKELKMIDMLIKPPTHKEKNDEH